MIRIEYMHGVQTKTHVLCLSIFAKLQCNSYNDSSEQTDCDNLRNFKGKGRMWILLFHCFTLDSNILKTQRLLSPC